MESTLSSDKQLLESPVPETMPRFSTTGNTAQVSTTDGHYSSIPSTDIDDLREESIVNKKFTGTGKTSTAEESVEEVSSAIANACMLHGILTSLYVRVILCKAEPLKSEHGIYCTNSLLVIPEYKSS